MLDWSQCPAVESVPGKVSGAWVFRGTRIPAFAVFENLEDGVTIDQLTRMYDGLTREQVEAVREFAARSLEREFTVVQSKERAMAEAQGFDPFVNTEEVEIEPEELAILEERDTDDESQFVSLDEAQQDFNKWLSESPSTKTRKRT